MRKINYPLIVSDFDGTLVKADGTISETNKQAISKYIEAGGAFAISTGRMPSGILSRARELGLKGMMSACQGAIIMDIETGKVISSGVIPHHTTLKICKKMEEMDLHIHAYDLWDFYCNKDDEALKFYEKAVRGKAKLVLDKPLSQFIEETGFCSYKFLAMVLPNDSQRILKELDKENFEGCCTTQSDAVLVEVINKNYSKGTAVETLANYYNVPLSKTIAIGDQRNDISMIEKAGLGVAVKNADDLLKQAADYVCEFTNEENAVAAIIEKFGFSEE